MLETIHIPYFGNYVLNRIICSKFVAGREIVNLIVSSEDAGLIIIDIQRHMN